MSTLYLVGHSSSPSYSPSLCLLPDMSSTTLPATAAAVVCLLPPASVPSPPSLPVVLCASLGVKALQVFFASHNIRRNFYTNRGECVARIFIFLLSLVSKALDSITLKVSSHPLSVLFMGVLAPRRGLAAESFPCLDCSPPWCAVWCVLCCAVPGHYSRVVVLWEGLEHRIIRNLQEIS